MATSRDDEKLRVVEALRRYGYQSQSYNILQDDKSYFFSPSGIDGVIAYVSRARVALAAGDPVCHLSDLKALVIEFRAFCKERKWKCCFQSITDRCGIVLTDLGFGTLKIGEEPIFDLGQLSGSSRSRGIRWPPWGRSPRPMKRWTIPT